MSTSPDHPRHPVGTVQRGEKCAATDAAAGRVRVKASE
jgi:hypothetical protein